MQWGAAAGGKHAALLGPEKGPAPLQNHIGRVAKLSSANLVAALR